MSLIHLSTQKIVVEGVYLREQLHVSAYLGDAYHQAPLLLPLFSVMVDRVWMIRAFFTTLDIISGFFPLESFQVVANVSTKKLDHKS